jgi:branched-chain amino acid transport system permease protein
LCVFAWSAGLQRCSITFDGSLGYFGLGLIEGLTKVFYPEASATVVFIIMVIVLLVRPAGLFGREK